uniref:Serine/threonine-protein phosphatase T n=1 Tax=Coccolithus braarudii TaxID=221442 RepID=A0A7S0Q896_9EUKA|mmetsp:Transcript_4628/g.10044  ORF Transcript_4628/g.10044 Transcript_4628/m.10044 type:complete len:491 (+) Transcript_4628:22-1494(+)|eukprot:CAMPEP_0183336660 /NCGR_PEP_ID=MMETSP0164_2-20130417/4574_1 /TAXON_ID=221442 /ORGANISM="Coccolithus pelagicus ssp braarudi, Strain PLY182g" /LENGTH=490 /DNA_ID=CAMNT_0025506229 /DNA_START=24 /DNA_END=1496 /DNA_ORIENTATION=+
MAESAAAPGADEEDSIAASGEALKQEGNKHFVAGRYHEALEKYNDAIELNPEAALFYTNRAQCHIKMENHGLAIADATLALELDKMCTKGYYRRGAAYMALSKHKDALKDFSKLKQLKPRDKDVLEKYKACEKEVKREAFERAIHQDSPDERSLFEDLDVDSIVIEEGYSGPRPSWPLTHEGMLEIANGLKAQQRLHRKLVIQILLEVKRIFEVQPSLVDVEVPPGSHINVCGDTHGQFYDLLHIFELYGYPGEDNPFLFNGDFVDRGSFSLEVVMLLFACKALYPGHLHLSRGNHETLNMNKVYGFEGEVKHKYSDQMFKLFTEVFHVLPLGYVLGGKVMVVHGGLFSKDDVSLDDVRKIDRKREPPDEGLMSEMLWSDPQAALGRAPSKRGVGLSFGPDVTANFLEHNGLSLLVRSHEVKDAGYEVEANGKLVTVFSAPNYCDQMGNKGALLRFDSDMQYTVKQFDAVPHPPIRAMAYAGGMGGLFGL